MLHGAGRPDSGIGILVGERAIGIVEEAGRGEAG
jgi:hypothetical protein